MLLKAFKSKIHRATVTKADLHYEGSITIDKTLMDTANIFKYEAVWVWNINNGERLMTYVIEGKPDSGVICLNGSAARLCQPGDLVIITAFADMSPAELYAFKPTVVLVDEDNKVKRVLHDSGHELEPKKVKIRIKPEAHRDLFTIAKKLKKEGFHIVGTGDSPEIIAKIDDVALLENVRHWEDIADVIVVDDESISE